MEQIPNNPIEFIRYMIELGRVAIAQKIESIMPDIHQDLGGDDD